MAARLALERWPKIEEEQGGKRRVPQINRKHKT